jgi:hypothetical protein
VLGSIATAERKARRYAKDLIKRGEKDVLNVKLNVKFYARLAGVSEDFMHAALAKAGL